MRLLAPLLLSLVLATPALAEDLEFSLINRSGATLNEFYASPSDVGDWEDDILGVDVLADGETARITIADGRTQCEYDLRFVWTDGDVVEDTGVNLCETGRYTLTD